MKSQSKSIVIPILNEELGILDLVLGRFFDPILTPREGPIEGEAGNEKTV